MTTGKVLVGVDGSDGSYAALRWALEVAAARGGEVEAVRAWSWDLLPLGVVTPDGPAALASAARAALHEQLDKARADRPPHARPVRLHGRLVEGDPALALADLARGAALLVVGRHGTSAVRRAVLGLALGAVATACLSRSSIPVAVVPQEAAPLPPERLVVGLDGSARSKAALRWAVAHAAPLGAPVVAVLAWQLTTIPPPPQAPAGPTVPPLSAWQARAEQLLDEMLADVVGADSGHVRQAVVHKPAAAGLLTQVGPADLLVLGDRGHGALVRLLLGSVARQCAEHAPCPVVLVPTRRA